MRILSKKEFGRAWDLIEQLRADHEALELVEDLNLHLLDRITHAESALSRHQANHHELNRELKTGRVSKQRSLELRRMMRRTAGYIETQKDQLFIWRCFGDALAFLYLDSLSIKHAFYETDRYGVKEAAGRLSGKEGLDTEIEVLRTAIKAGVPAVLCDLTHTLRYGDVCLLGGSDPYPIEVKRGSKLNKRGKRQVEKLQVLHEFLSTDSAEDFRGGTGTTRRAEVPTPTDNTEALQHAIAKAQKRGWACEVPEAGVQLIAIANDGDTDKALADIKSGMVFHLLNVDKNERNWSPYTPFILTIKSKDALIDFIEGRLFVIVAFDPDELCRKIAGGDWEARFVGEEPDYPLQVINRKTGFFYGASQPFLSRIAYDFVRLSWVAEAQSPKGAPEALLDAAANDERRGKPLTKAQVEAHRKRIVDMFGEGDEWAEFLLNHPRTPK